MSTVTSVNDVLQALVAKRLYKEFASGDSLWHVVGYLGGFENKLRNSQTYWGVPLMEYANSSATSLKLTIPKYVMDRAGASACDYVCARGTLRVAKQFRSSAFEVYLSVTELRLLDAPATLNGRRQEASTLQMLKSVAANRNPFPEQRKPIIAVIHSRSQEAQVYADFCQPLRAFDSTISLQPIPANMPSAPELTYAIHVAAGTHIPRRAAHNVRIHDNTSRNCMHRTTTCGCSCAICRSSTLHNH